MSTYSYAKQFYVIQNPPDIERVWWAGLFHVPTQTDLHRHHHQVAFVPFTWMTEGTIWAKWLTTQIIWLNLFTTNQETTISTWQLLNSQTSNFPTFLFYAPKNQPASTVPKQQPDWHVDINWANKVFNKSTHLIMCLSPNGSSLRCAWFL